MSPEPAIEHQRMMIDRLKGPGAFPHDVASITLIETHISYVLLTGVYAYKIKKAIGLDFLDFRTLASRRHFCGEELRLNRRLAPDVYLDVVPIGGTIESPAIGGAGPAIEYAVRMLEFPQEGLFSRMIAAGTLTAGHIDALAQRIASFHQSIGGAPPDRALGSHSVVQQVALDNFGPTESLLSGRGRRADLDALRTWTTRELSDRRLLIQERLERGFVRECHGDLHLANIALVNGQVTVFDCIEFNDRMRWIDVMSEVAFTTMDLEDRGRSDLGFRFLNGYLEASGDYEGVTMLPLYLTYRAMVRAKVTALRGVQVESPEAAEQLHAECRTYVNLALRYAQRPRPALIILHGCSGSGKTTCGQALLESMGAIRIRTDVERKRLHGLRPLDPGGSALHGGLYTDAETMRVYRMLSDRARTILAAGFVAIVDGAFLKRWQRDVFRDLATELAVPFVVVEARASEATMRARIVERLGGNTDASDADLRVLDDQIRTEEAIGPEEERDVVPCDTGAGIDITTLVRLVNRRRGME